jgi:hypothetical protein
MFAPGLPGASTKPHLVSRTIEDVHRGRRHNHRFRPDLPNQIRSTAKSVDGLSGRRFEGIEERDNIALVNQNPLSRVLSFELGLLRFVGGYFRV